MMKMKEIGQRMGARDAHPFGSLNEHGAQPFYRPQTKFAKVMLHVYVILSPGGVPAPRGGLVPRGCLLGGACSWGVPGGDLPRMATAAGSMHPMI